VTSPKYWLESTCGKYVAVVSGLALKPFTSEAAPTVAALLQEHGWSAPQIAGQLEALGTLARSEDGLSLTATADRELAGFISVQIHRWNRLAQIHGVAVRRGLFRRGYATQLVDAAEAFARDHACRGVYVDTPVDNKAGRAFYVACGYAEDYRMTRYYADDLDGVTYVKFF
jgi:ribosomal protein S18 acetylase RimI-like enzyme